MPYVPNPAARLACKSSTKVAKNSKSIIGSSSFYKWCSSDEHSDRHLNLQLQGGVQSIYNTKTAKNHYHSSDQGSFVRSGLGSSPQFAASRFSLICDFRAVDWKVSFVLHWNCQTAIHHECNSCYVSSVKSNEDHWIGRGLCISCRHALVDQSTEQLGGLKYSTHHGDEWHEEKMIKQHLATYDGFFLLFH